MLEETAAIPPVKASESEQPLFRQLFMTLEDQHRASVEILKALGGRELPAGFEKLIQNAAGGQLVAVGCGIESEE